MDILNEWWFYFIIFVVIYNIWKWDNEYNEDRIWKWKNGLLALQLLLLGTWSMVMWPIGLLIALFN